MTWLMAHMWLVLAATGLLAALLGWSVRGMLLVGKLRKAAVERDIARVELGTARDEIEKLFKATRQSPAGDSDLRSEIASRDSRIADLTNELAKAVQAASVVAAAPGAATAPAPVAEEDTLVWRNRHLEQRVAFLESELAAAKAAEPLAAAPAESGAGPVDAAKLAWEADYLRQRVSALESQILDASAVRNAPAPVEETASAAPILEGGKTVEEELAALRWRNRFLEGRVAYFEGEGQSAATPPPDAAPISETILGKLEAADAKADAESGAAPEKPPALEKPVFGKPDDLTVIGGIGPKIQDVLNSLGVFHFDQIAAWTPANIAWVDEHLNFSGRITREGWVEQAAVLVQVPDEA